MVQTLLEHPKIDLGIVNKDHKTCYEAYADEYGFDEASNILEEAHQI